MLQVLIPLNKTSQNYLNKYKTIIKNIDTLGIFIINGLYKDKTKRSLYSTNN